MKKCCSNLKFPARFWHNILSQYINEKHFRTCQIIYSYYLWNFTGINIFSFYIFSCKFIAHISIRSKVPKKILFYLKTIWISWVGIFPMYKYKILIFFANREQYDQFSDCQWQNMQFNQHLSVLFHW